MASENLPDPDDLAPAEDAVPEDALPGDELNPSGDGQPPIAPEDRRSSRRGTNPEQPASPAKENEPPEGRKKSQPKAGPAAATEQKRRTSMFEEAKDAKALFQATGGKMLETLEALFVHKTNSAELLAKKPVRRPKKIYENTYRLEPSKPFCNTRVETVINLVLEQTLDKATYNADTAITTAATVAEKIRACVLAFEFDRFKYIVHVTIGPMSRQGVNQGFRCSWDSNRDSYAQGTFRNHNVFASAVVYAIYFE